MDEILGITDKQFKEAEQRHEDKYKEELESVDIRAVVLKTKKALLEQARVNARCERGVTDQMYQIRDLETKVNDYVYILKGTEKLLSKQSKIFTEAIELLSKKNEKKGFFSRLFKWMK